MALTELQKGWDECLYKLIRTTTIGASIGFAFSLLIAKKRLPTTLYFAGLGTGCSYAQCERMMRPLWKKHDEQTVHGLVRKFQSKQL
mmetsp:Transcript_13354/g.25077  ORF Transcript_13354/g.25077 Transcript_13354/m.25077 type:complete len:87 (-) Transcript_13354:2895-3155(-)